MRLQSIRQKNESLHAPRDYHFRSFLWLGRVLGFGIAMTAHYVGLDNFFRQLYPRFYHTEIRSVLAAVINSGWILGVFGELPDELYALLFSFLAGGLISVTMIDELPRVNTWRAYFDFCFGALIFTGMILEIKK